MMVIDDYFAGGIKKGWPLFAKEPDHHERDWEVIDVVRHVPNRRAEPFEYSTHIMYIPRNYQVIP